MPLEIQSDVCLEKVAMGMDSILGLLPREREQAFVSLYPVMVLMLRNIEVKLHTLGDADADVMSKFTQTARIYVRALATYRAVTEEWLNVFTAFKKLFDRHLSLLRVQALAVKRDTEKRQASQTAA